MVGTFCGRNVSDSARLRSKRFRSRKSKVEARTKKMEVGRGGKEKGFLSFLSPFPSPYFFLFNLFNILSVRIDDKLSFKDHLSTVLRKVYAKVGALRRLRKLVPANISLMLYKAYILPHLEYCSPLLLGINKTLNKKLESANYYALKALLNFGNSLNYDVKLSAVNMQSLEHRRYYQSLVLLFKCIIYRFSQG